MVVPAMTFDEFSLEHSKSFVKALQELKNLRPQLYSAAEYCEKSYLHSEKKQMVLDNLKEYAVQALVNAVDHLGTVAYKLTDLLEQQTWEVSTMELKASCLNQQLLTCQTYTSKQGLKQQQLLAFIPRHHKHYILPNSVHFSPHVHMDYRQNYSQASLLQPSDSTEPKPFSWYLASGTKPNLKGTSETLASNEISKPLGHGSEVFQLFDNGYDTRTKSSASPFPASTALVPTLRIMHRESEGSKPMTAIGSFDNQKRPIIRAPVKNKSLLSAFFVKQKAMKIKAGHVA
ncbi:Protein ABIL1 [Hibiscus syriacus]|uniref:Protein ABIL1 n=1 Tax=Hibiscus syriacus TaxID=106335 RepID=A0A6A2XGV9_HIBSY|nr:protein ABIL1-like [Hibiscus syriacus]KAE8657679.1 Protein ABIL1 [Hibiscus syriacus]